jgi:hypothetical protein
MPMAKRSHQARWRRARLPRGLRWRLNHWRPGHLAGITLGAEIAGLNIYREALTAEQVKAIAAAPPDFALPTYEEAARNWPVQDFAQAGPKRASGSFNTASRQRRHPEAPREATAARNCATGSNRPPVFGVDTRRRMEAGRGAGCEGAGQGSYRRGSVQAWFRMTRDWLAATVPGTVLTTMIDRGIYPDPDYGLNNLAIPESLAHQDYWYRVEFKAPPSRAANA